MIWPRPISPSEACAVSAAAASLRPRKAETSRWSSPASARFSSITFSPVTAPANSLSLSSKMLPLRRPKLTRSATSLVTAGSLRAAAALSRWLAAATKRSLTGGICSLLRRSAASTRTAENEIRLGAQLQHRLQRDEIVVGERAQRAPDVGELALVGGRLDRQREREGRVVHHRHELLGELLVRGAHRADQGRALGRDRLAFRDRPGQPVEIFRHAAGGFLELRGLLAGKRGHRVVERGARGIERLERARALVRAGGGEQCLRLADHVGRRRGDVGGTRHMRQARAGDDLERAPEAIVRHERGRARQHRGGRDGAERREQPAAQAEPEP